MSLSPILYWQKSSFSGGGDEEDCVEIAATTPTTLHLRESDHPTTILTPTPTALRALLTTLRS
ncbi:DUF397 domain-containing protein [Streptomyces sp. NBC_00828]|uniref:DUF397 domain-containing protein n=1 Tax=Streptomyces sp. NBC_00828 TaxID=2903678 RepID=UPI00386E2BAA